MENKYTQYSQLPFEEKHLDTSFSDEATPPFGGKWLPYLLMSAAIAFWVIFNIVAIESYAFSLYPLVVINLILYFIIAVKVNPDNYCDS